MAISNPYLALYHKYKGSQFGLDEAKSTLGATSGSTKVILSRLKAENKLFSVGWGRYVVMSPFSYMKLKDLGQSDPVLFAIVSEAYHQFPNLCMLVLYGSRVTGRADELSDYDVMLVLPEQHPDIEAFKSKVERDIGGKLHLTVYSAAAYKTLLLTELYLRFWISEGMIFDEAGLSKAILPPIPKLAYLESLTMVENYVTLAANEKNQMRKVRHYFTALKTSSIVESALGLSYDFSLVRDKIEAQLGKALVHNIRARKQVTQSEIRTLKRLVAENCAGISKKLRCIGENESDLYWRESM